MKCHRALGRIFGLTLTSAYYYFFCFVNDLQALPPPRFIHDRFGSDLEDSSSTLNFHENLTTFAIMGGIVLTIVCFFFLIAKLKKTDIRPLRQRFIRKKDKTSMSATPAPASKPGAPAAVHEPIEYHLTAKTKSEIRDLLHSVKSIQSDELEKKGEAPLSEEQVNALQESGVLQALTSDLVSTLQTKETPNGLSSNLSLDVSMVFEGEGAMSSDIEIEMETPTADLKGVSESKKRPPPSK